MAIVGLGISCSQRETSILSRRPWALSSSVSPPNSRPSAMALTSPPAQKPRPAPVTTTTPTLPSSARRGSASSSASSIAPDIALSRSGRFSVRVATPSLTDSSRSWAMAILRAKYTRGHELHAGAVGVDDADLRGDPPSSVPDRPHRRLAAARVLRVLRGPGRALPERVRPLAGAGGRPRTRGRLDHHVQRSRGQRPERGARSARGVLHGAGTLAGRLQHHAAGADEPRLHEL